MEIEVKIEENGFKGRAVVDVRPFAERAEMVKSLAFTVKDGEADSSDQMDKAIKVQEMAKKHTRLIDVEFDGKKFNSFDELECYEEGQAVINKIATFVLNGVKLSKN